MKWSLMFKMIFLIVFWLFLNGCGTGKPVIQTPPPDIPSKVVKSSMIQKISFVEEENYTRVQIEGSEVLESPFYKLLSDPLRIAIDVPNIDLKQIKEPVKINNGTVGEVLTTQFDDKGRIEIGLAQMTNYNILKEDRNLNIDIEKVKKISEVKEEVKEETKKEGDVIIEKETAIPPAELKKEEAPPVRPVATAAPDTLQKAKNILNFSIDQKKDFIALNIIADGKVGDYHAFKMDSPPRLVLDILGVDTRYPKRTIDIQNPFVKKVRIGRHPDKLRFVFESPTPNLPSYQIDRVNDKLIVSFGNVSQLSGPQIVLPEKTAEKPHSLKSEVKAPIDFKQMDNKSRIVVSLTEEPQFASHTISKNTIAVDIKNAFLPKHLQRGLNTSGFDSAVKYIDLKNVKKGKASDVRVLITLKEEVPFKTSTEGKTLFIDIEKPKKMAVVPEAKKEKEEVSLETKKQEVKGEAKEEAKEEGKKEEEKPVVDLKKPEKILPVVEQKPVPQQPVAKKAEEEKMLPEEARPEKVFTGRRLSLDFKDADIKNILRLIAEVSNFNIITGDDVTGKITMRLVDVPWDQALDLILQARSLGMTKVGNVIRIAPLDSLKKEIQAELESRRAKEKLEDLVTELISVNYASGKEILPQLKGILSDRGDAKADDRTNILIVKDIARNIVAAKDLVKSLDTKTPQVLIEARIVQADLTFQRDLGISWGFMATSATDGSRIATVGGGTKNTSDLRGTTINTRKLVDLPSGTAGSSVLEFLFTSDYGLRNLDVAISAYESKGDVNVISSPKIATLDNKEASVEQGLRIPYTKLTDQGTPTEEFIEANLKLTVTPHVTNDGHIKMSIKVKKDEPNYDNKSNFGTPSIDKKEAVTEVLVKDNGVVVIAGIYTIKKNEGTTGVPLFSKIPILGWLFKKESKKDERRDLLIFISPKIFKDQV